MRVIDVIAALEQAPRIGDGPDLPEGKVRVQLSATLVNRLTTALAATQQAQLEFLRDRCADLEAHLLQTGSMPPRT